MHAEDHRLNLLIVGVPPDDAERSRQALEGAGITCNACVIDDTGGLAQEIRTFDPDLVLSGHSVGPLSCLEILELIREYNQWTPLIIVTSLADEVAAARCLGGGVAAWVTTRHLERLGPAVVRALLGTLRKIRFTADSGGQTGSRPDQGIPVRRQTENAMRLNEADLNRAQSIAQIGSWEIDLASKTVRASDEALRIYGLRRRDLTMERIQEIPLPEYRTVLDKALEDATKNEARYDVEFKIRRPTDGALLDIRSIAEYDAETATIVGTIQDVTSLRAAENARRKSEQRYRRLFERNLAGVYRTTPDGRMLDCNDAFVSILGCATREAALNRNAQSFYFDSSERSRVLAELRKSNEVRNFEVKLVRCDGTPCWCLLNAILIRGDDGEVTSIEGTLVDITDRKQIEIELDESREMMQAVVQILNQRIFWKDLDGRYLGCNDLFAADAGCSSPSEIIGRTDLELSWAEVADAYRADDKIVMESGEAKLDFEEPQVDPQGRRIWLRTSKIPLRGPGGGICGVLGTYEEITDRKLDEEKNLHAKKMEAVAVLAAGVGHEFNNLLQGMLGTTHELRSGRLTEHQRQQRFDELTLLVERGSRLTRQLLVFSNRDSVASGLFDLNEIISSACELLRATLPERIDLILELSEESLPVRADQDQVEQVLINIATNAQEAMAGGGRLVIRSGREASGRCFFEIEDNGCGIAEDTYGRIFEPFFTTKEAGAGIGLTVVHNIVGRYGGVVEVKSRVGRGTVVRVLWPDQPSGSTPDDRSPYRSKKPVRTNAEAPLILVVDDEPLVREGVQEMLSELKYPVKSADSVASAREALSKFPIDLLLTDVVLPDGSGTELVEIVNDRDQPLPTIVMTGYSPETLDLGRIDVPLLLKPFGVAKLEQAVREALGDGPS